MDYDGSGNAVPKKLNDRANVNKRRRQMGLEPLEEYLAKMTEMHRQMNKKINGLHPGGVRQSGYHKSQR